MVTIDIALFADKNKQNRLSTRYWVDNLMSEIDHRVICKFFMQHCPHIVELSTKTPGDMISTWTRRMNRSAWCAEHTSGYWMDGNFPDNLNTMELAMKRDLFAFQSEADAVMFKLRFI